MRQRLRIAALALVAACSGLATDSPLSNARTSPEALARAALDAIARQDPDGLAGLLITRDEYETLVWPSLPDSQQMPFSFVWGMAAPRSRKARNEALYDYRNVPLDVVGVELGDEVEAYENFALYHHVRLTVRRTDTGQEDQLELMDVLIEMGGGWKFMNFHEG